MQLIVGRVVRPHGIRGEVVVEVRTDAPDERFVVGAMLTTDPTASRPVPGGQDREGEPAVPVPATLTVASARPHQGRYLVFFEGVADRDAAEPLRGVLLCVDSADVPAVADPDEFHDFELIGLVAFDVAGQRLGEVIRIDHAPASDLLVLRRDDGRTALVPFVKAIVPEVDVAAGRLVVAPPEGLFEL